MGARDAHHQSGRLVEEMKERSDLGYSSSHNRLSQLMPATRMNYSLTCQINNDPVFSGLLSPCPTYRFLGGGEIIWIF